MIKTEVLGRWTKERSEELYGIKNWGGGYFSISDKGEVVVNPYRDQASGVSIMDIISGVGSAGWICRFCSALRIFGFADILLNESFGDAMKSWATKAGTMAFIP